MIQNACIRPVSPCPLALAGLSLILLLFFLSQASAEEEQDPLIQLDQIVVTGTKTEHALKDVPVTTMLVTGEDIKDLNAENVMDLLSTLPGIQTANHEDVFGAYTWNARMNGLSFNDGYALILIDGQRVMGCGASGGMGEYGTGLNQIPVSIIERIEVVKGPGSALYGSDAMAGVVNIITKKIPRNPSGTAGMAYGRYSVKRDNAGGAEDEAPGSRLMNQAYVTYGDRITDRSGYFLSYSYEGADDVGENPLLSSRHSFMGKVDSKLGDRTDLSLKYEAGQYAKTGDRDEDTWGLSAKADVLASQDHRFTLSGYTYLWQFTHGTPGGTHGYKVGEVGFNHGELQYTLNTGDKNILSAGVEVLEQGIDYYILNSDMSLVTVDETVDVYSLYLQDEWNLGKGLTLVGGARFDDHSTFGDEVNPKFSVMYKPSPSTIFRASAGQSFKSPTIRQLYYSTPYRHGDYYNQSNPDLSPEKAMGYTFSVEQWFLNDRMMFNLGFSRNDVEDMVIIEDTGTLYNGLPLRIYRNVDDAYTQSVELLAKAKITDMFRLSLAYTYMDSENEENGKDLTYTPEHSFSLVPALSFWNGLLDLSATLSYTGRQYTSTDNTSGIKESATLDTKAVFSLSPKARLSFEADNVFDSAEGQEGSWQVGRSYLAKIDLTF